MLKLNIPEMEFWDEDKMEFVTTKETNLQLEHSLVSLSKWEAKWCKPFLSSNDKTVEETLDYIKCMTLTQNVKDDVYTFLRNQDIELINEYIASPQTASWINEDKKSPMSREQVTAELIYYWMISLEIPFECQKWHLNRLMMLIRVCWHKNKPPKKPSKGEIMRRHAAVNAARRKK